MYNNSVHQSEYPEASALQEAGVKRSHSVFGQYNPGDRHALGAPVRGLSSWKISRELEKVQVDSGLCILNFLKSATISGASG